MQFKTSLITLSVSFLLTLSSSLMADPQWAIERVEKTMREKNIPAIGLVFVEDGKPFLYGLGYAHPIKQEKATPQTIFELGSITKVFTSTALAVDVLQGKMRLDAPVIDYLPMHKKGRIKGFRNVTVRELATHTSSLPRDPRTHKKHNTEDTILHWLHGWQPPYPIDSKYLYSNLGFGVLGYALAYVNHSSYFDAIRNTVLEPLNMHHTWIEVPRAQEHLYAQGFDKTGKPAIRWPHSPVPGGGALRSNAHDMSHFLLANMGLEGPEWLQNAMRFAQQPRYKVKETFSMGLGWQNFRHGKHLIIDKNGGVYGFTTYIGFIKEKKLGIVLLANKLKTQLTNLGREILLKYANAQEKPRNTTDDDTNNDNNNE